VATAPGPACTVMMLGGVLSGVLKHMAVAAPVPAGDGVVYRQYGVAAVSGAIGTSSEPSTGVLTVPRRQGLASQCTGTTSTSGAVAGGGGRRAGAGA
jgi:hypothetical protein